MGAAEAIRDPRTAESIGELLGSIWQTGYVTSDLDRAREMLADDLGLSDFVELSPQEAMNFECDKPIEPWTARFATAVRGDIVVELVEPVGGAVDFYRRVLPRDTSFAIRFHHLAVCVPEGDAEWDRVRGMLAASGLAFHHGVVIPDRIRAAYVDTTAQLGHMLEICQMAANTRESYLKQLQPETPRLGTTR